MKISLSLSLTSQRPSFPTGFSTPTSEYWLKAQETHDFVVENLLTSYNSYRVNTTNETGIAYEWYNASQIYADAAMIQTGDTRYIPYMNNSYDWMNNMWDRSSSNGGYYAAANVDGTNSGGDKYADDNSLTGNVYLDAYSVSASTIKDNYLNSAKACANWLMNSGQWDSTYGGGFWWNTVRESKPTQTNGLALQLFLRLYQITGQIFYRDWAYSIRDWLMNEMFDVTNGLYIWKIDGAGTKHTEKFTYDNAIMIEAFLLYAQIIGDSSYVMRAQTLGIKMNTILWDSVYRVYLFNSTDIRINPAWCGWASQAMIKLYLSDGNTYWLDYAQQNIDYMNSKLRNSVNNGYYAFCNVDGSDVDTRYEGVDQAWMQRVQVLLSNYR